MLRRGELLYWHEDRWLSPEEYRESEKGLAKLRRAAMDRYKHANNWYNKAMKKEAAARRGLARAAEAIAASRKPLFDVEVPSNTYASISDACKALGLTRPTIKKRIADGVLKMGVPTDADFQHALRITEVE